MSKSHLILLGIGISATSLIIGAASLGIAIADVKGLLSLIGVQ